MGRGVVSTWLDLASSVSASPDQMALPTDLKKAGRNLPGRFWVRKRKGRILPIGPRPIGDRTEHSQRPWEFWAKGGKLLGKGFLPISHPHPPCARSERGAEGGHMSHKGCWRDWAGFLMGMTVREGRP